MSQQKSESYLSTYHWHCDGDEIPWLQPNPGGGRNVYDGKITTASTEDPDYLEDARDNASVEALAAAKKIIIKLPPGIVSLELRSRSDGSESDDNVLQVFCAAGVDHYMWHDQLTFTQGTQVHTGTSIYFADTIASSDEFWMTDTRQISPTNDHVARNVMNVHGYDRLWIVASTLATTTCYIDWKQL